MRKRTPPLRSFVIVMGKRELTGMGYDSFEDYEVCRVKAAVNPKSSGSGDTEYARQLEDRKMFNVVVRYIDGLTTDNWFIQEYQAHGKALKRRMDIVRIIDRDDLHRWFDILCEEKASQND